MLGNVGEWCWDWSADKLPGVRERSLGFRLALAPQVSF